MARYLISTTLTQDTLENFLQGYNISIEEVSPPRMVSNTQLLDVELTLPINMSSSDLLSAILEIRGIERVIPIPNAEPF